MLKKIEKKFVLRHMVVQITLSVILTQQNLITNKDCGCDNMKTIENKNR